jgi:hypothetical protein
MLKEVYANVIREGEALKEIFLTAEFNIKAIRGMMEALDVTTIDIFGFKFNSTACGYMFNGEKVSSTKAMEIQLEEADAVYQFVKMYPKIIQELTDQVIEMSNTELERSLIILKDKMVESSL